jgi:Cft2 family RNA processing exonuclease
MAYRIRAHRLGRHASESSIEVSCGLLDIMDGDTVIRRVMTDCGLASHTDASGKKVDFTPDFSILQDGKKIDAVRLTHMHLDHAGSAPLIVPYLAPDARVFVTKTSAAMMPTVLKETLKIAEKRGQQPLYDESAYLALMNRVTMIERPGEIEIAKGFMDYVHPAGHMPGACSFTTRIGNVHLHYAGDRCTHDQPGTRVSES